MMIFVKHIFSLVACRIDETGCSGWRPCVSRGDSGIEHYGSSTDLGQARLVRDSCVCRSKASTLRAGVPDSGLPGP